MNDPMEGIFRSSTLLKSAANYREAISKIQDKKSGIGVACFSETYENMLMWAHYAGNFTGLCFGYSTNGLLKGLPNGTVLVRLAYLDQPPRLSTSHVNDLAGTARRILSQKQYNWSYEREWRVLAGIGELNYGKHQALREIYFGTRMPKDARELFISIVRGTNIQVYDMELSGYKPGWQKVIVSPH
jgi:hypothetical protein